MKAAPFVPTVAELSPEEAGGVPHLEVVVSHWTAGRFTAEGWLREVGRSWGTAGFYVRRGDEVDGFIVYGPGASLPLAGRHPLGPADEDAVLLAYVGGDTRTSRRLLVRMLRDLRHRGIGRVEAITSDRGLPNYTHTDLLLESGWRPVRHAFYKESRFTLARTDLKSAVEVRELARALVGRVKLPHLKAPIPAPDALARAAQERGEY